MPAGDGPSIIRFGPFDADLQTQELRKHGMRLRLPGQSFLVLKMLIERSGQLVTREELRAALWPSDTFVDFDQGLNAAVNRLREALGDSADSPHLIETLPRRGYRFIAAIDAVPRPLASGGKPVRSGPNSRTILLSVIGGILALLAATAFFVYKERQDAGTHVQRTLTRLTFDDGLQAGATWSPDGRFIAYGSDHGGKFDIWVRQVGGGDPVQITKGPDPHWQPDWSPDGKYIAYRSEEGDGGIYIVPALGGAGLERKVAPFGYYPRWSPDGTRILFQTGRFGLSSKLFVVGVADSEGPREVLGDLTASEQVMSAEWHPDGKRISIWCWSAVPFLIPKFWTKIPGEAESAKRTEITPEILKMAETVVGAGISGYSDSDFKFRWAPSGKAVYFERTFGGARNIWRMAVDPQTLRAIQLERLTTGVELETELALSADGRKLAFTSQAEQVRAWMFPFDTERGRLIGPGQATTSPGMEALEGNLSRDDKMFAFSARRGGISEIWEKSFVDGNERLIAAEDGYLRDEPQWSPEGTRLAYVRLKVPTDEYQAVIWDTKNRNEQAVTPLRAVPMFIYDWSVDGQWLLASVQNSDTRQMEIWRVSAAEKGEARKVIPSEPGCDLWQGHYSPDNHWIAFEAVKSVPTGFQSAIYVAPAGGGSWVQITDGRHWDDKPRWSPDGKRIYFVSERGGFLNVFGIGFDATKGNVVGEISQVTQFESASLVMGRNIPSLGFSLTRDRLIVTAAQVSGSIWALDNVDR
jgi:Tol biopolymer transport system component/DNA-binding winged helix-turn-helix (wHTH) protein